MSKSNLKDQINNGEVCRECLDESPCGPMGYKWTCVSCTRRLKWEEERDEQYVAEEQRDDEIR